MNIEPLVKDIIGLEAELQSIEEERKTLIKIHAEEIKRREEEISELARYIDIKSKPYEDKGVAIAENIQSKKSEIETEMRNADKKTIELDIATVQMKTTKSVKILDKVGLVNALAGIQGGIDGIKTFALSYIRKLIEVGVITEDLAELEETRRVYITAKEKAA